MAGMCPIIRLPDERIQENVEECGGQRAKGSGGRRKNVEGNERSRRRTRGRSKNVGEQIEKTKGQKWRKEQK